MSGENQKFGLTLGEDENQTVYMCLGQGDGEEVHVNDMVYGVNSLLIQKAEDISSIYLVGKDCRIELHKNEQIKIIGKKVFIDKWEIVPELESLQD